jgi:hypothetical protein
MSFLLIRRAAVCAFPKGLSPFRGMREIGAAVMSRSADAEDASLVGGWRPICGLMSTMREEPASSLWVANLPELPFVHHPGNRPMNSQSVGRSGKFGFEPTIRVSRCPFTASDDVRFALP